MLGFPPPLTEGPPLLPVVLLVLWVLLETFDGGGKTPGMPGFSEERKEEEEEEVGFKDAVVGLFVAAPTRRDAGALLDHFSFSREEEEDSSGGLAPVSEAAGRALPSSNNPRTLPAAESFRDSTALNTRA